MANVLIFFSISPMWQPSQIHGNRWRVESRQVNAQLWLLRHFCYQLDLPSSYTKTHSVGRRAFDIQTLPKAQRTRGLNSSCQSNFLKSYHKFKHKSWSNFCFILSTTLTSKSQPNISISSQTNCREINDGVSESVSDKGSQCRQLN